MADNNKVQFGLSNCYYAKATDDGNGVLTYATPVPIPGAVNLNLEAQGDTTPFYADNIIYFTSQSNSGYSGSLEVAQLPESFRTDILGERADTAGVLVETSDAPTVEFALLFEFQGDVHATKRCMYRCTASRPAVTGATKEAAVNPQTETINITVMPRISDHLVKTKCNADSTAYAGFYNTVYEPDF